MILKRKLFAREEKKDRKGLKIAGGIAAIGTGAGVLEHVNRHGEISGRKRLYHVTDEKNIKSILENGLKGSEALNPNNPTNSLMNGRGIKDGRKLVYVGENRVPTMMMKGWYKGKGKKSKELKISMDFDEYKRLKQTDQNPEFYNAKTAKEWKKKAAVEDVKGFDWDPKSNMYHKSYGPDGRIINGEKIHGEYMDKKLYDEIASGKASTQDKIYHKIYKGGKGSPTKIIEGDIESKFIKGGKGYEKNSLKKVAKYVKNNPGRFAKGTAKALIGTGAIIGGGKLIKDSVKTKEK